MKKHMTVKQVGMGERDVLLFLHDSRTPHRDEWDQSMADLNEYARTRDLKNLRCLVITDGGGPDTAMRGELMEFYKAQHHYLKTAVITNSLVSRGIVAAVSWFNPYIKAFSPRHFGDALDHLELARSAAPRILREAQNMERELSPNVCLALITGLSTSATL